MKRVHEKGKRKKQKSRALQAANEDAEWAEIESKTSARKNRGMSAAQIRGNLQKAIGGASTFTGGTSSTSSTVLAAMTALLSSKAANRSRDNGSTLDEPINTVAVNSEGSAKSDNDGDSTKKQSKKKRKASRRGKKGKGSEETSDGPDETIDAPSQTPAPSGNEDTQDTTTEHNKKKRKLSKSSQELSTDAKKHSEKSKDSPRPPKKDSSKRDTKINSNGASANETPAGKDGKVDLALERVPGTAYVRDVPLDASRTDVSDALKKFGEITSCRLVFDKVTRKPNGTAFVDFAKATSVKKAAAASRELGGMDFIWCRGRRLRVDFALTTTGVHAIVNRNTARPSYTDLNKRKKGSDDAKDGGKSTRKDRGGPGASRRGQRDGKSTPSTPKTLRIRRSKTNQ